MWKCDNCYSEVEDHFMRCWNCDTFRKEKFIEEPLNNNICELLTHNKQIDIKENSQEITSENKVSIIAILSFIFPILGVGIPATMMIWNKSYTMMGLVPYMAFMGSILGIPFSILSLFLDKGKWLILPVIGGTVSILLLLVMSGVFN